MAIRNEVISRRVSYHGREPISMILRIEETPLRLYDTADLAAYAVTFASFTTNSTGGTAVVAETSTGVSVEPSKTVSYDSVTGKIKLYEHGLDKDDEVIYTVSGGGNTMGDLVSGERYFLRDVTEHYFKLCKEKEGTAITLDAGSGTHTIKVVGQVIYTPQSNAAYPTAGTTIYGCFFAENTGTEEFAKTRFPCHPNQSAGGLIEIKIV